ncbi:MAG: low molecular weight phosphatase family protein [Candidatus Tectomicrobia bacterium]|uniref:Low molecular weight phosphatase family protein n=1 Tax=Tectimicrobiota bacterium TaxID=2528274 RepID=A0A937VXE3_UNCTE|nr:low molecular weight phosphatase family protein [Candidatus Tectomicrobia bacterium]
MHTLLFLCTGNYYRSRFAELLFNALATAHAVPWQAFSRGLALVHDGRNPGPMSPIAIEALNAIGITSVAMERFPLQVAEQDFQRADRIIALHEDEHKPYLQAHYPAWLQQVDYWHVRDGVPTPAYNPLHEISGAVRALMAHLRT